MPAYNGIQKEETLKATVFRDYFDTAKFAYEPNIGNIDFIVTDAKLAGGGMFTAHYLWAEAKKGTRDVFDMFTQLILTCKKTYEKGDCLAPPWLGCFDEARIAFVPFHEILPIFVETDFNWNTAPSNSETSEFKKAREKIEKLIGAKIVIFNFASDENDIKEFIKTNFTGGQTSVKIPITKDNFVQIFIKWIKEVRPHIMVSEKMRAHYKELVFRIIQLAEPFPYGPCEF